MSEHLGRDFGGIFDIDRNLTVRSGRYMLGEAIARRWLTPPGALFYDPDYGLGIDGWINGTPPDADIAASLLEKEALKDERVEDIEATVTIDGDIMEIRATVEDADGPFALTLTISELASTTDDPTKGVTLLLENL